MVNTAKMRINTIKPIGETIIAKKVTANLKNKNRRRANTTITERILFTLLLMVYVFSLVLFISGYKAIIFGKSPTSNSLHLYTYNKRRKLDDK